jgi:hypothetical protein
MTVEPLFKNYKKENKFIHRQKTQKLYLFLKFWRNREVLSEQTSDSSAFLNAMRLLKVCIQLWTAFFFFHISIRINWNRISGGLL